MATRREALAAAFDELETEAPDGSEVDQPLDPEGSEGAERHPEDEGNKPDGEGAQAQDEGGKEGLDKNKEKVKKSETPDEKERKAADRASGADGQRKPAADQSQQQTATKAPASWSPALREKWGSLPADARAHILKREREIDGVMRESAGIKKFGQDLAQIVNPHLGMIQAMQSQPLPAIKSLLDTAGQLYNGNSETKAGVVAQLIWRYGVDIKTLDHILANRKLPNGQPVQDQPRAADAPPAWAQPIFQFMNQAQEARQQMTQREMQQSQAEIEAFAEKAPFFEDVREEVADLMEAAYNRGRVLTLQQAYDRAVSLNPEISQIIEQRKAAARQQNGNVARARRAASTIRGGSPNGGGGGSGKGKTRREQLAEAWDNAEG